MPNRQSIDFGSFTYWKIRPQTAAPPTSAPEHSPSPPAAAPDATRRHRKHPHRSVDSALSESVRASIVINEYLSNEREEMLRSGATTAELDEYDNVAGEMTTFMQEFEGLPPSHFEPPPDPPLPNKVDLVLTEKQKQLEQEIEVCQKKIQFWEDKLAQSNELTFREADVTDRTNSAIAEQLSQLHADVKETLITNALHTDRLELKQNQMMCVTDALNASVRNIASHLIADHIGSSGNFTSSL